MKLLFDLDGHDYEPDWKRYVRNSSRGIIIRNGLIGMVHSTKFDYYKFPGGGIEKGESRVEALIREVAEEAGLVVLRSTIRPYGYVHRIQKSNKGGIFVQDNYYYFCKTARTPCSRHLDEYEKKEGFTFSFVDPRVAIATNREKPHGPKDRTMLEREAAVLELLIKDGYFEKKQCPETVDAVPENVRAVPEKVGAVPEKVGVATGNAEASTKNRGTGLKAPYEKCSFDEADGKTNGSAG